MTVQTRQTWGRLTLRVAWRREWGVLGLLLLTLMGVGMINPAFVAPGNLRDMLVSAAPTVIVACGLTFVLGLSGWSGQTWSPKMAPGFGLSSTPSFTIIGAPPSSPAGGPSSAG